MDTRRLLTLALPASLFGGCAALHAPPTKIAALPPPPILAIAPKPVLPPVLKVVAMKPIYGSVPVAPAAPLRASLKRTIPKARLAKRDISPASAPEPGRSAIALANAKARARSRAEGFVGGEQVFPFAAGHVYEVWTAPLRVTTLTLEPGETVTSKAAGDTVRWQIGETTSGEGETLRGHVMIKPLAQRLETNLVLSTNRRVYLIELRSGSSDSFNAEVTWSVPSPTPALVKASTAAQAPALPADEHAPLVSPTGPLDARYRIASQKGRPRWAPTAVMNDGARTFICFSPDLQVDESPALFVVAPDGETRMVNYRQQAGLWVVDRVFDQAELRLGGRHPEVVRITRITGRTS